MPEYEDAATVKFGKELTEEEKEKFREYVEEGFALSDVEWYKVRTD